MREAGKDERLPFLGQAALSKYSVENAPAAR